MMSNFSVKSDSGINLPVSGKPIPISPAPPTTSSQERKSENKKNVLVNLKNGEL